MARIAGVNLPNQKRLEIGLTYIYGIGQPTAREICVALGLSPDTKVRDLTDEEVTKLQRHIDEHHRVEGDLRRERQQAIKRLIEIGAYRGLRTARAAGERAADEDERAHAEGAEEDGRPRQEGGEVGLERTGVRMRLVATGGPAVARAAASRRTSRSARHTSRRRSTTRSSP